jgi:hypothetical protein
VPLAARRVAIQSTLALLGASTTRVDRVQQHRRSYQQVAKPNHKAIVAETSVRSWVPATHLRWLSDHFSDHPRDALTYATVRASIACAACFISSLVSHSRHRHAVLQQNGVGRARTRAAFHLVVGSELDAGDAHANRPPGTPRPTIGNDNDVCKLEKDL